VKFLFPLIVWGEDYVDEFLERSLPTQLAFGNLGDFPWLEGSQYLILTTSEDRPKIERAPIIRRLRRLMDVQFVDIDDVPRHNKYIGASKAQFEALRHADGFDAVFFLYPDFLCATGTIQNAARRIAEGWDAVMFPIPAVLATILEDPAIRQNEVVTPTPEGKIISIPPRLLVDAANRNYHPMISGYIMGSEKSNLGPAYMMWEVPDEGYVLRCFHLHPFVIRVQKENPYFLTEFIVSLDEEYVPRLFRSSERIYFPSDSDEFAMCSIRAPDSPPQPLDTPIKLTNIVHWAEEYASLVHREFVGKCFRWHAQPIEDEAPWEAAEEAGLAVTDLISERLATPDSIIRFEDEVAFAARARRRHRFRGWRSPVFGTYHVAPPVAPPAPPPAPKGSLLYFLILLKRATGLGYLRRYPGLLRLWMKVRGDLS
tara:strand:- start:114704 stop:115984 length:1281 start_codon:yes stop_codon:yes gene_type:complete